MSASTKLLLVLAIEKKHPAPIDHQPRETLLLVVAGDQAAGGKLIPHYYYYPFNHHPFNEGMNEFSSIDYGGRLCSTDLL